MKFKKLMLVTFILLAILTIGAASAADDTSSDDVAVSDIGEEDLDNVQASGDDDLVSEMSQDDVNIDVDNEVDKEDTSVNFTNVEVTEKDGNFVICTGEGDDTVELYREDLSESERGTYDDENGVYTFGVSLNDINSYIASNIDLDKNFYDILEDSNGYFYFVLEYDGNDLVVQSYEVDVGDDSITFTKITDEDEYIYVNEEELDLETSSENQDFTGIVLQQDRTGTFKISRINEDEDDEDIFSLNIPDTLDGNDNWFIGEENYLHGVFYLTDLDLDKINDKDCLKFYFINADDEEEFTKFVDVCKNESTIQFTVEDEEDDFSGEGKELEGVEFRDANAQTNDVVIVIPMENFPEEIANEFSVIVLTEEDKIEIEVELNEIEHDDSSYYIKVGDLGIEDLEIGEGIDVGIIVQFYNESEEPIYYAQALDEDGINIFNSPYIFEEASIFADDDVITFQEVPEGVDEFKVIIQKENEDPVEKTFKFSELENQDEEGGVWYALTLNDLGINETGDYKITVQFSEELTYTESIEVTREIGIHINNEDDEGDLREFTSIDELVLNLMISENIKGYVNLTIDENEPVKIEFTNLKYDPGHPPDNGRQILLNDLNIQQTGIHTIKWMYMMKMVMLSMKLNLTFL